jgi:hypothetical protein
MLVNITIISTVPKMASLNQYDLSQPFILFDKKVPAPALPLIYQTGIFTLIATLSALTATGGPANFDNDALFTLLKNLRL